MNWTNETPTQKGWYWMAHDPTIFPNLPPAVAAPSMVQVFHDPKDGWCFADLVNQEDYRMGDAHVLWCGPIEPPPLPSTVESTTL